MTAPSYATLNSDPAAMFTFMQNNIIATGLLANSNENSRPEYLELHEKTTPAMRDGKTVGLVYYLKKSDKTTDSTGLLSYICDYEKNGTKYAMLGDKASFCFTITMNGCTFGVGAPNSSGDVIVSHSNRAIAGMDQAAEQRAITLGGHKNQNVTLLEPSLYRPAPKMTSSTFGIRQNGAWKFYFLSYRPNGSTWDHFGVVPV